MNTSIKNNNIVKKPFNQYNHETIINGIRFTMSKIINAKKHGYKQCQNSKPKFLVFNLSNATISVE